MRRIKMLEYALRMERSVITPRSRSCHALTLSCLSSKQLTQPISQNNPPSKLPAIQSMAVSSLQKDDVQSQKEESGDSSPRSEGMPSFFDFYYDSNISRIRLSFT